jgi:hypothetical protein
MTRASQRSRDIEGRVAVEETSWLQRKADVLDGHHRPILGTGDVRRADGGPDHELGVAQGPIGTNPLR